MDLTIFTKAAVDIVGAYVKAKIGAARNEYASAAHWNPATFQANAAASIDRHIREVVSWSSRVQFYGMSRAEETDTTTIALRLQAEPRRFRGPRFAGAARTETDLLMDDSHYLLLGDPGAGKTTTLKRLANVLLTSDSFGAGDSYQFPIVIRLRELPPSTSLVAELGAVLGIRADELIMKAGEESPSQQWLGNIRLEHAIAELLSAVRAVVMVDGLDEVTAQARQGIERDIESLTRNSHGFKLIASCRTGDYTYVIDGLDLMEICPLTRAQILEIAGAWVSEPDGFLTHLSRVPYADVADRPLLLTQLLFIYKQYGYLPEQPNQIYKKVLSLLLQEWDAERRIVRPSRYATFVPERKAAFLSALAYHLTFRVKQKTFSLDDLRRAYVAIREPFALPFEEAQQVATELETHSGIIVAAGSQTYEFSHLSLQEYLCADYLVREPFAEYMTEYMSEYPAPVAVAVSLAAQPSHWFAALFLNRQFPYKPEQVHSFLARLLLEMPYFSFSDPFGVAILKLYEQMRYSRFADTRALLDRITQMPTVLGSIGSALRYFTPEGVSGRDVRLKVSRQLDSSRGFATPDKAAIPVEILLQLAARSDVRAKEFARILGVDRSA